MSDSNKKSEGGSGTSMEKAEIGVLQSTAELLWAMTEKLTYGSFGEVIDIASDIDEEKMYGHGGDGEFLLGQHHHHHHEEAENERLHQAPVESF